MEHTQNVDVTALLYQVGNPIVFVKKNANLAGLFGFVPMPKPGMVFE